MKTAFFKSVLSKVVLFAASCAASYANGVDNVSEIGAHQNKVYNCVTQVNGDYKYEYVSDNAGRVLAKTAYKWDNSSKAWKPSFVYTVKYGETSNILSYAAWDEKKCTFSANCKSQSYDADKFPFLISTPTSK